MRKLHKRICKDLLQERKKVFLRVNVNQPQACDHNFTAS